MPNLLTPINGAMMFSAQMQLYFGIRDSVRGLLFDTNAIISGVRNELGLRATLLVSILAIGVALVSATVDVRGAFVGAR